MYMLAISSFFIGKNYFKGDLFNISANTKRQHQQADSFDVPWPRPRPSQRYINFFHRNVSRTFRSVQAFS